MSKKIERPLLKTFHFPDGSFYYENMYCKIYYNNNNVKHRIDGPAVEYYDDKPLNQQYFFEGALIPIEIIKKIEVGEDMVSLLTDCDDKIRRFTSAYINNKKQNI